MRVKTNFQNIERSRLNRSVRFKNAATRPLAINILGDTLYFPTVDLTKNVCELVDFYGDVAATYDYAPFGAVSAGTPSGSAVPANPFQFSSEVYDEELGLVYYNYRHYSPALGRFLSRDPIQEQGGLNLYVFCRNDSILIVDRLGGAFYCPGGCNTVDTYAPIVGYRPTPEQERYSAIAAAIAAGAVIMGPALAAELSLTEISALSLAGKTVSELMRKIKCLRCKIQVHSAHHEFLAFYVTESFPYVKFYKCFRKHINIMCYIKGKRGSDIRKQIPYSKRLPRNG